MSRSPELDIPYPLTLETDCLMLHEPKHTSTLMQPVTNDLFAIGADRARFNATRRDGFRMGFPYLWHSHES